jgi:hypothetical protein
MSKKIYDAMPEDFIRRMRNWARAVSGQIDSLRSSWAIDPALINHGLEGAPIPILEGEAMDTDVALRTLPERYRWAVEEFWSREGRSLREHTRGRDMSASTFETWVMVGHDLLRASIARQNEQWRRLRSGRVV